ncbi:bolA-like protein 3 [Amyelois transitella]|uniref:bolA-like protein 3 n=1 Tax=Amyelois transitella TaxID=680683 RepID=UPI00067CA369|nr:bolA-like protein 3 [Amyelois transitella]
MLRQFIKSLVPVRSRLARAVAGASNGGETASAERNAFQKNSETKEQQLSTVLKQSLPGITYLSVEDISGGCGAMFEISVEAKEFVGLSRVKQHRLVTDSLKTEIAEMHGIRIHTTPTSSEEK